jgi:transposase
MGNYTIGCDAHKRYSQFTVLDSQARVQERKRVEHTPGAIREYLRQYPEGTPVAVECVGNWYWIVDDIEAAGCKPKLTQAGKAKAMMGHVNKTDKLDADGLALLLYNGTLPTVWIPSRELRDERELPRTRMAFSKQRTAVKNRIHAILNKHAILLETESDVFSGKGLETLRQALGGLPPETRGCVEEELALLSEIQWHIDALEARIRERIQITPTLQLLKTLPGIGDILAIVIDREIGLVERFATAENLASYAGTTPKVKSSGGKTYYGPMRKESNQYLKWAFVEAANVIVRCHNYPSWKNKHVVRLYERTARRKGHAIAVGAVARHLAEASYWVLTKGEAYHQPNSQKPSQSRGKRVEKLAP